MQLSQFGRILRRNLWIIVVATLLGAAIAFALSSTQRPVYNASSRTLFSASGSVSSAAELTAANALLLGRIETYTSLLTTPLILDPVIQELGLNATSAQIASSVSAQTEGPGNVVSVSASSSDPASAASLANAVAESLASQITNVQLAAGGGAQSAAARFEYELVDQANPPSRPAAPDIPLMALVGGLVGFALGVILAGIRAYTDQRVRVRADIAGVTSSSLPVEGIARAESNSLVSIDRPADPAAEAYRRLFAEIASPATRVPRRLLVTSPQPHSTTSSAAANLATVIAEGGSRVTLIDADLRGGSLAAAFGLDAGPGLSEVLDGKAELHQAVRPTARPLLSILPSGSTAESASALIASQATDVVFSDLEATSDVIVVNAPAVLRFADAVILAERADAAVLVVASGDTRKADVGDACEALETGGTAVRGVVLTSVPKRGPDARWR
ncbi:Wzz/FepE/Etk N-terminal domain-containing protein [Microbacterium sp. NPDC064584]|uniref:Wzz/FepE/Etk N-terminal domain-containing protein n=1 Tax=Microbacterium sp. NPDC064584 TaxID=3155817 RepID=UPI0034360D01